MDIRAITSTAVSRQALNAPVARERAPEAETETGGAVRGDLAVAPAYISPIVRYDNAARMAVLTFRDHSTGEVTSQIPPERIVAEYRKIGGRPDSVISDTYRHAVNTGPVVTGGPALDNNNDTSAGGSRSTGSRPTVGDSGVSQGLGSASGANSIDLVIGGGAGAGSGVGDSGGLSGRTRVANGEQTNREQGGFVANNRGDGARFASTVAVAEAKVGAAGIGGSQTGLGDTGLGTVVASTIVGASSQNLAGGGGSGLGTGARLVSLSV